MSKTAAIEGNRNHRWVVLHHACQLSADVDYARSQGLVYARPRAKWYIHQVDALIGCLRDLRHVDGPPTRAAILS